MSYRDELEAARQRADALEKELEEKERALAEKARALAERDQVLAEKERALADAREDLDDAAAERRKAEAAPAKAREALDELAQKGKQPKPAKPARTTKPARARSPESIARRRLMCSVTILGDFIFNWDALIAVPLSAGFVGFFLGWVVLRLPFVVALPAGALAPLAISFVIAPLYATIKLGFIRRWPGTLPYRLEGYPELLEIKPRTREAKDPFHVPGLPSGFSRHFDPGGHTVFRIALRFSGEPPANLAAIVRGFDPALEVDPDSATTFSRESPVTEYYSKSGSRRDNSDDNWRVHKWIRRCNRKVLRHLATAHKLASVQVSLHSK